MRNPRANLIKGVLRSLFPIYRNTEASHFRAHNFRMGLSARASQNNSLSNFDDEDAKVLLDHPHVIGHMDQIELSTMFQSRYLSSRNKEQIRQTLKNIIVLKNQKPRKRLRLLLGIIWFLLLCCIYWKAYNPAQGLVSSVDLLRSLTSSVGKEFSESTEKVLFSDIIGCEEAIGELKEIAGMLRNPGPYRAAGVVLPKGILLTGPPGTGKTLMAKALAHEAGCKFFYCSGSDFDEMLVGLGSKRIRSLFKKARKSQPAMIFIDEIDALGGERDPSLHAAFRQAVNQILNEMDGFKPDENIVVIGATNLPQRLDPALTRSGRFDKKVHLSLPSLEARKILIKKFTSKKKMDASFNIEEMARRTMGMSGADIRNLVNLATINSVKNNQPTVHRDNFDFAYNQLLMGIRSQRGAQDFSSFERRAVAIHEAGHTLISLIRDQLTRFYKVTILPAGQSLGHTAMTPNQDFVSYSKEQILEQIDIKLGGRAAEELYLGESQVTSGCGSDLRRATDELYQYIRQMGMEESKFLQSRSKNEISDATNHMIDQRVESILKERYDSVKELIKKNEPLFLAIVDALVQQETLDSAQVQKIRDKIGLLV